MVDCRRLKEDAIYTVSVYVPRMHFTKHKKQTTDNKQKSFFLQNSHQTLKISITRCTYESLCAVETVLYTVNCVKCALHIRNCLLILFYGFFWSNITISTTTFAIFLFGYCNFPHTVSHTHWFMELHTLFLISIAHTCRHFFRFPKWKTNDTNALARVFLSPRVLNCL